MMRPHFNSLPNNQIQANGTSSAAPPQQVMPCNNFRGNSSNSMPNSTQFQPQTGVINNPQIANPFNNYNIHPNRPPFFMNNAPNGVPSPPSSCLMMNGPNGQFPLQNGMSPMALPQFLNGFGLQNISSMPMNQINTSQPNPQLFAHNNNSLNMAPYFNQNVGFPNGQMCLQGPMQNQMQHMQNPMQNQMQNPVQNQMQNPVQNQMQNMGQFVQMQMPNYTQVVQGNMPMFQSQVSQGMAPQNGTFMMQPSQVSQSIGPQSATFVMKPPFGPANSNGVLPHGNQEQHRLIPLNAEANGPNAPQQLQGSSSHSGQPQQTQNFGSGFVKSQGNPGKENGVNVPNTNWKNSPNRNFTRHTKSDASHKGSMSSQFNHTQNANGKFRFHNERGGKAYNNGARKSGLSASSNQTQVEKRRSLPLNYTEQEIQQWREERKKNYPSKDNVEKKLTKREIADAEAVSRRQQLKEILAKQAELGCEVAEIPMHYLSDSEKQVGGKADDNKRAFGKKGRQQNNFNKRGRFNKSDRFTKKQGPTDHDASNANDQNRSSNKKQRSGNSNFSSLNSKREPTLLHKLLATDVRRDKAHLLQVFRFMVMNSYFKDWHEKQPLRFPNVVVKEAEGCLVEEKVVSEGSGKVVIETEPRVSKEIGGFSSGSIIEEEEGEIID